MTTPRSALAAAACPYGIRVGGRFIRPRQSISSADRSLVVPRLRRREGPPRSTRLRRSFLEISGGQERDPLDADRLGNRSSRRDALDGMPRGGGPFLHCPIKALVIEKFFALCADFGPVRSHD